MNSLWKSGKKRKLLKSDSVTEILTRLRLNIVMLKIFERVIGKVYK